MRGGGAATAFGQGQIRPIGPGPSCLKGRLTTLFTGYRTNKMTTAAKQKKQETKLLNNRKH